MNHISNSSSQPESAIPPDDLRRKLTFARPNEDQKLSHIALAGDTYTILVSGDDTAGRYCLIDMLIPPGADLRRIATILRKCLRFLTERLSSRFAEFGLSRELARRSISPLMRPISSEILPRNRCDCSACVHPPARKHSSWRSASRSRPERLRRQNSLRQNSERGWKAQYRSPPNTELSFCDQRCRLNSLTVRRRGFHGK